ncbi:MAG: AsmA-like C-terminal region-containing protein [Cyclobacteriaceae bacterium]|nr:AsmA-like C-terminal region-containing protein [Cyclobacteriaceae bacterium]
MTGLNIDSIFYVFNNFSQNWLVDKNLKGKVTSDVKLYMNFNKNLVLNSNSLIAEIDAVIENGELNDFEPMMQLSKFVEEKSLARMRFSRMTNHIKIENRTIYLPEMEIRSNVSNILVNGTHTFDHVIDYHLSVPLKNFLKISQRPDYTEDASQGINLLLKITGTTADYKISLDSKAIKRSIKKDITDERQEWKKILDKTKTIDEEVPVLEDEFFDFDEQEQDSPN